MYTSFVKSHDDKNLTLFNFHYFKNFSEMSINLSHRLTPIKTHIHVNQIRFTDFITGQDNFLNFFSFCSSHGMIKTGIKTVQVTAREIE